MNKVYLFITLLSLVSCQNTGKRSQTEVNTDSATTSVAKVKISESVLAKKWLIENIEANFRTAEGLIDSICTKHYATYKSDAIGVEYDGGMTQQAFEKKWKGKFDVKHAGIGTGFLISGQDWERIKVVKCKLSPIKLKEGYLFAIIIEDLPSKTTYKRDVKVRPYKHW
jgi:hypothetical protein